MATITYKEFNRLSWLNYGKYSMKIYVLPTERQLKDLIRHYNPNLENASRNELLDYIKNNLNDKLSIVRYDGMELIDFTLAVTINNLDLLDYFVYAYYAEDNVIILTMMLLE